MLNKIVKFTKNAQKKRKVFEKFKYYRMLRNYKKKALILPYSPLNIRIEPTNHCNLKCIMCPQAVSNRREKGYMDMGLYNKIIAEARGFSYPTNIMLYLAGESLLHKDFIEMVKIAKKAGLFVSFNTNATLLNEQISRELLNSSLDRITISFDDVEKETYESTRINASYDRVLNNIISFLRLRKGLKKNQTFVIISSLELLNDDNYIEKTPTPEPSETFNNYFKDLSADIIRCEWAHGWAGDFKERSKYRYKTDKNKFDGNCFLLWRDIAIAWDGKVVACCNDFDGQIILGDLKKDSITDIWNGEAMIALRRRLLTKDVGDLKLCRSCVLLNGEVDFFKGEAEIIRKLERRFYV